MNQSSALASYKIHTTEMGIDRIKRNLKIDTADVVEYCKNKGKYISFHYLMG